MDDRGRKENAQRHRIFGVVLEAKIGGEGGREGRKRRRGFGGRPGMTCEERSSEKGACWSDLNWPARRRSGPQRRDQDRQASVASWPALPTWARDL